MKRGNTEIILTPFLEGAREAGAEVEVVYLRRMKIQPCIGCFNCWFRTPGICAIKDDIHILRDKLMESDIIIYATPVYLFSCTGYMKILMERLLFPFTMPEFFLVDNKVYHPARFPDQKWKSLLIANGAFDGEDVFKPLIDMYERMLKNAVNESEESIFPSLGSITIGFAELFADENVRSCCSQFFGIMKNAGQELAGQGFLTKKTLATVNKPVYYYAEMTRQQAILKINTIVEESKNRYILPNYLHTINKS